MSGTEAEAVLNAALDRLIPPVAELPGAGAQGIATDMARLAAEHPPHAAGLERFRTALAAIDGFAKLDGPAQDAALAGLETAAPQAFAVMLELAYIAYYSRPEVHKRIGWRTGPLQPAGFDLPPFDDTVLQQARRRAPFWRRTE